MLGKTNSTSNLSPNAQDAILQVTSVKNAVVTLSKTGITQVDYGHKNAYDSNKYDYYFVIKSGLFNDDPWTVTVTDGIQTTSRTVVINEPVMYSFYLNFHVPSEYQEVEYLEASRGPAIDLGYPPIASIYDIKARFTSSVSSSYTYIDGSEGNNSSRYCRLNGSNQIEFSGLTATAGYSIGSDLIIHLIDTGTEYSVDIGGVTKTGTVRTSRSTYNLHLFDGCSSGSMRAAAQRMNGRIYYYKITDPNGNRITELYPCYRKSDLEPGMWDCIREIFYTNIGAGAFTVGGVVH